MTLLRQRTRAGYGVAEHDTQELKPLAESYIRQRRSFSGLSLETTPETSNLTRTGDMLDSLYYSVKDSGVSVSTKGAENLKKAIYTSVDRPWANLSDEEVGAIKDLLSDLSGD